MAPIFTGAIDVVIGVGVELGFWVNVGVVVAVGVGIGVIVCTFPLLQEGARRANMLNITSNNQYFLRIYTS